jgi:hypothetical protein
MENRKRIISFPISVSALELVLIYGIKFRAEIRKATVHHRAKDFPPFLNGSNVHTIVFSSTCVARQS